MNSIVNLFYREVKFINIPLKQTTTVTGGITLEDGTGGGADILIPKAETTYTNLEELLNTIKSKTAYSSFHYNIELLNNQIIFINYDLIIVKTS